MTINQKYLGAIDIDGGLAWCEVATGKLYVDQITLNSEKNFSEITLDTILESRFNIVEILFEDINKANLFEKFGYKKNLTETPLHIKNSLKNSSPTPLGMGLLQSRKYLDG